MDPLSICASAIAVLQAANSLGKTIGKLRSLMAAGDEISLLLTEISDLKVVFQNTKEALEALPRSNDLDCRQKRDLLGLLNRALEASTKLELFIKERLIRKSSLQDDFKINYLAWLSAKPRLQRYQTELKSIQTSFVSSLSSTILVQTLSTALRINEMNSYMKGFQEDNDKVRVQIQHTQLIAGRPLLAAEAERIRPESTDVPPTSDLVPKLLAR
ncbi:MAG: hypothetical protein Q9157_003392 [Trypethelium eluteriae]